MRGDLYMSLSIVFTLILLAVIVYLVTVSMDSEEDIGGYMGLPEGVWMSVESLESSSFAPPPVIWFGGSLEKSGAVLADFSNIAFGPDPAEFVFIGDKSIVQGGESEPFYGIDIRTKGFPTVAMYPLLTDKFEGDPLVAGTGSYGGGSYYLLDPSKSFGKIKLSLVVDAKKIAPESGEPIEEIWFMFCWDSGGEEMCYAGPNDFKMSEEFLEAHKDGVSLGALIGESVCKEAIPGLSEYWCTFEFEVAEKCCPGMARISPKILVGPDGKRKEEINIAPITFFIVYYFDYIEDRDFLFDSFSGVRNSFSVGEGESRINPVSGISIYPCRANVPGESALRRADIKDSSGNLIDWGTCIDSTTGSAESTATEDKKDSKGYFKLESGWRCKKTPGGGFYIYNPYAYCALEGDALPKKPKPVYIESIIPSGDYVKKRWWILPDYRREEYAWLFAKNAIDALQGDADWENFGIPEGGGVSLGTPGIGGFDMYVPTGIQPGEVEVARDEKRPVLLPESWTIKECDGECSALCTKYRYERQTMLGGSALGETGYVCDYEWVKAGNKNSACGNGYSGCKVILKNKGAEVTVECQC
ncbi:MAG: hypothetical protein ACP5E4_00245 [Candidatus Aenigmatarchaeota archaeon]